MAIETPAGTAIYGLIFGRAHYPAEGYNCVSYFGEKGWRSGESARLPPMWPGFESRTRRHMCVEFVVGSLLAPRGFSPCTEVFLSPQKPTFRIPIRSGTHVHMSEYLRALRCYVDE